MPAQWTASDVETQDYVQLVFKRYQAMLLGVSIEVRDNMQCVPPDLNTAAASLTAAHFAAQTFDPSAPVNAYGESLTDAMQNSIVRGQNGILTP